MYREMCSYTYIYIYIYAYIYRERERDNNMPCYATAYYVTACCAALHETLCIRVWFISFIYSSVYRVVAYYVGI